jgi:hypothetical protein
MCSINLNNNWRASDPPAESIFHDLMFASWYYSIDTLGQMTKLWNSLDKFKDIFTVATLHGGWAFKAHTMIKLTDNVTFIAQRGDEYRELVVGLLTRQDLLQYLSYMDEKDSKFSPSAVSQVVLEDKDTQCFLFDYTPSMAIVLRAECITDHISSPLLSLTHTFRPPPPIGTFSQSFPEVDDLAKNLQALSLEDLQTFFHAAMSRSGETIELPGVKLPGEAVTSWGIVILVIIQVYFFVIFNEFCARVTWGDKAWNIPWIGISRDVISKAAFGVSMLIVLCAVGYLSWRGIRNTSNVSMIALYGVAIGISAAIVGAVFLKWASLPDNREDAK